MCLRKLRNISIQMKDNNYKSIKDYNFPLKGGKYLFVSINITVFLSLLNQNH